MRKKTYVAVLGRWADTGTITPLLIFWREGQRYPVDKVLDCRPMASTRAGGYGLRFTCRIGGQITFLYYEPEHSRWFVEEKEA